MITFSFLHVVFLVLGALVGILVGIYATKIAAKRNVHQGIEQDPADEAALLELLWADPVSWLRVEELLRPEHFAVPAYAADYEKFNAACAASDLVEYRYRGESDEEMEVAVDKARSSGAGAGLSRGSDEVATGAVLALAELVLGRGQGRGLNSERSRFSFNEDTLLLSRISEKASPVRVRWVGVLAGASGVVWAWALLVLDLSTWSLVFGIIGALALIGGSVVVSCVDLDTFYLDLPWFFGSGLLAWGGVVAADIVSGHTSRIYAGLIVAGAVAGAFELVARLHHTLDGQTQGAGDTWIVLVSVGVVGAFTGDWRVGLASSLGGCLLVMVFWAVGRLRGLVTKDSPIPFGPYLAAGSTLAMVWWMAATAHS